MSVHVRMFRQALNQKLAFTPPPQAPGPGGAPVGPQAGAMDPMAGGAPPMDPAAAGAMPPPADPAAAGGAPPADPAAAGGAPPMDPAALAAMAGPPPGGPGGAGDPQVPVSAMKDFAVSLIEAMKGKKTQEAAAAEAKAEKAQEEPAAGPITGLPGLDPSALQGPIKMGAALAVLTRSKTAGILMKDAAVRGDLVYRPGANRQPIAVNPVAKPSKPGAPTSVSGQGMLAQPPSNVIKNLAKGMAPAPTADDYDGSGLAGKKPTF